jgi:uncharacterized protein involved in outer membrane biogenesis
MEWPFLRGPIESTLRHTLKRNVTLGADFGVRFIGPLQIRSDLLVIGPAADDPQFQGQKPELMRASGFRLALPYTTLLTLLSSKDAEKSAPRERLYIKTLVATHLDATLLRTEDGRANWRFGAQEKSSAPPVLPAFGRLAVSNGKIRFDDALTRLNVIATVHSLDESAAASTPPSRSNSPDLGEAARGLEITVQGHYREQPLSARVRTSGLLSLADTSAQTPPLPLKLEARVGTTELDFDGIARDIVGLGGLDGQFRLAGPSLSMIGETVGVTLPTTAKFSMRGRVLKEGEIWSSKISELSIGSSRLNGSFRYDPTGDVPKLTGQLAGALSMPDLGPAVGVPPQPPASTIAKRARPKDSATRPGADAAKTVTVEPRLLPQREFDIPSLAAMNADVTVALDQFDLGTSQLETMAPFKAHMELEDRLLTLKDIVGRTADGEMRGAISLDARRDNPLWNADLRWSGVQLERFVKPRNVTDRQPVQRGYVSGTLEGNAKLHGSGRSTARILGSLEGGIQLWVRNGKISHFLVEVVGLDIAQALGMVVRGDDMLPVQCAIAALDVRQGKAETTAVVVETSDSTLSGTGFVSLADERLGLVFKSQPKDISPISLRSPVHIEGTFANPEVGLEKTSIGLRLAAAAALAAITPVAAVVALFDLGETEKQVCLQAMERMQSPSSARSSRTRPSR